MINKSLFTRLAALLCALALLCLSVAGCGLNKPGTPNTEPTQPTEPSTQPTQPSTQPTEPPTQPTQPPTQPTEPPTQPTEPDNSHLTDGIDGFVVDMVDDAIISHRYRLPYVNAPGYEKVNQVIREQLLWQASEEGWDDIGYSVGYKSDAVSILVRCEGFSDDSAYYTYHFSRTTGRMLTQQDILNLFGLNKQRFDALAKEQAVACFNDYNLWLQEEYPDMYAELLQITIDQTLTDTQVFVDVNGNLGFVAYIGMVAGSGHYDVALSCRADVPIVNVTFPR